MSGRGRDEREGGKLRRPNGEGECWVEEEKRKGWF